MCENIYSDCGNKMYGLFREITPKFPRFPEIAQKFLKMASRFCEITREFLEIARGFRKNGLKEWGPVN